MKTCLTCGVVFAKTGARHFCSRHCYRKSSHGLSGHPLFDIWKSMVSRCQNPKDKQYSGYGARGIAVCDRWMDIKNFIADMSPRPCGHSIERVDNDKGYDPANCIWADPKAQAANRRGNRYIEIGGRRKLFSHWCSELKLSRVTVAGRLKSGWSIEEAFFTPVGIRGRHVTKRKAA